MLVDYYAQLNAEIKKDNTRRFLIAAGNLCTTENFGNI